MGHRLLSITVFVVVGPVVAASAASGATTFLDTFNTDNGGSPTTNYAAFTNFNVTAGSVDLIGNGFADFYPGNGLYVDLNGSTGTSGTLVAKATFDPGTYTLSFSLGNNPSNGSPDEVTVTLGGYAETFTRSGTVPLTTVTRTVVIPTAGPLTFATPASDSDNVGIVIDNVSVQPVPEPATATVVAAAAAAGLVCRRRR